MNRPLVGLQIFPDPREPPPVPPLICSLPPSESNLATIKSWKKKTYLNKSAISMCLSVPLKTISKKSFWSSWLLGKV